MGYNDFKGMPFFRSMAGNGWANRAGSAEKN
jgi:hypothetical protein